MAKFDWQFIGPDPSTGILNYDFSSLVLSMTADIGRKSYLDNYGSSGMTITINNNTGYATKLQYGIQVIAYGKISGTNYIPLYGWVSQVSYNDYNAATGISTATIRFFDSISAMGRIYADQLVLSSTYATNQIQSFTYDASPVGPIPSKYDVVSYSLGTGSVLSAQTYSGSVLNYLNASVATERGLIFAGGFSVYYVPRGYVSNITTSTYTTTLKSTTGTNQLMYQEVDRRAAGTEFINTFTTSPNGLTQQTATNSSSVTTYGPSTGSQFTYDNTTTQALGNAQWMVNTFGNPNAERIDVAFNDVSQSTTGLTTFGTNWVAGVLTFNLTYTPPAGAATTLLMVMEGCTISATPESTDFQLYLSPLTYYQFFTLDSARLGILDTSRLGW